MGTEELNQHYLGPRTHTIVSVTKYFLSISLCHTVTTCLSAT